MPHKSEPTNEREQNQACLYFAEEEEDEVNRGMRTEQIAEIINRQRLHIRKDGQPLTSNQVYAVILQPGLSSQASLYFISHGINRL